MILAGSNFSSVVSWLAVCSCPGCWANDTFEKRNIPKLKTATSNDLMRCAAISILKFAAKIRLEGGIWKLEGKKLGVCRESFV